MAEEEQDDTTQTGKEPKKPGKMLLLAGLALGLVLGGGGAAAFFVFGHDAENSTTSAKTAEAEEHIPAAVKPETAFVKMENLSAPLVYQGRILGYVLLDLSLEVDKGENELKVVQQLPALRAAFLIEVTDHPIGKPDEPTVIDYADTSKRLMVVANRELKGASVIRILITQSTRM